MAIIDRKKKMTDRTEPSPHKAEATLCSIEPRTATIRAIMLNFNVPFMFFIG